MSLILRVLGLVASRKEEGPKSVDTSAVRLTDEEEEPRRG